MENIYSFTKLVKKNKHFIIESLKSLYILKKKPQL